MFGIYNKLKNLILSWIFPKPKETKEDRLIRIMGDYLKLVCGVPFDDFSIKFYTKDAVEIYLMCETWQRTYQCIKQERTIEEDMGNMFPYSFIVNSVVLYMN